MATQAAFLTFIRGTMGINGAVLPDASPDIATAYSLAIEIVNETLQQVSTVIYDQAVYNLGGDTLINIAADQSGQTFFADLRTKYNVNAFVAGVISASNDESTGQSLAVPDSLKQLTLADLQNLKTPYGRQYLALAQKYGSTLWGLS